jgi:hypothetical protein
MLDAVSGKHLDAAVIQNNGYVYRQLHGGLAQNFAHTVVEFQKLGGFIETASG